MPDDGLGSDLPPRSPQRAVERVERVSRLCRDLHCPVSLHGREVYYISADASRPLSGFPLFAARPAFPERHRRVERVLALLAAAAAALGDRELHLPHLPAREESERPMHQVAEAAKRGPVRALRAESGARR